MIAAIIQARMSSTRLPGKVLLDLADKPVLACVVERVRAAQKVNEVIVATSTDASDDAIAALCEQNDIRCHRGSLDDVLARYLGAAEIIGADTVVRITGDCPLISPHIIDECIDAHEKGEHDYVSNVTNGPRTFPRGLDVEVFSYDALARAAREAQTPHEREHVTPFIWENKNGVFKVGPAVEASTMYRREYRLTLDYPEDYKLLKTIYETFNAQGGMIEVSDVLQYLDAHPEVVATNAFRETDHQRRILGV